MALNIRNSEIEGLANELAQLTGKTKKEAVKKALADRLQKLKQDTQNLAEELNEIAEHCAKLPALDNRNADDMLYDENGPPL